MTYNLNEDQIRFIVGRIAAEASTSAAGDYGILMADALNGLTTTFEQMEAIWNAMPEQTEEIATAMANR